MRVIWSDVIWNPRTDTHNGQLTVLLNSTDLIGWYPDFAFADWLESKIRCSHVVRLATLCNYSLSKTLDEVNSRQAGFRENL